MKAGLLSILLATSVFLLVFPAPISRASGPRVVQAGYARDYLAISSNVTTSSAIPPQNSSNPATSPGISCGFNSAQNSSQSVASSPLGSGVRVTVGEPSWLEICTAYGNTGESFPAYEVFPVTVHAAPGTPITFSIGRASHTPEQIAAGLGNNTIWTGFDPVNLTTDSDGVGRSNFTLAGAVMPFVPNDIANVSLPIIARSPGGAQAAAGLPIEFSGSQVGGIDIIHVLQAPNPIVFPGSMLVSAGNTMQYAYGIVYAPPAANRGAQPIQVKLNVAGTWNNGAVGPLPSGVQITIDQSSFVLDPNQVHYFFVDENNSIARSTVQSVSNYTFAIQENVGGNSFLEPLSVSVTTGGLFGSFGAFGTPAASPPGGGSPAAWLYSELGLFAVAAAAVLAVSLVYLRRRRTEPILDGTKG